MENLFMISCVVAIIYIILKYIEMKVIDKKIKPFKNVFRDGLVVFFSTLIGSFTLEQIQDLTAENLKNSANASSNVFTGSPDF